MHLKLQLSEQSLLFLITEWHDKVPACKIANVTSRFRVEKNSSRVVIGLLFIFNQYLKWNFSVLFLSQIVTAICH